MIRHSVIGAAVGLLVLSLIGSPIIAYSDKGNSATPSYSIGLVSSGLRGIDNLISDRNQQQLSANSEWTYAGWAYGENISLTPIHLAQGKWVYTTGGKAQVANVNILENASGLSIGAQSISNSTYTGFYAAFNSKNASIFHAAISSPVRKSTDGSFQTGMYVQSAESNINYVTCLELSGSNGTHWEIEHATGNSTAATSFDYLWIDNSPNQPTTNQCTIITNGNNFLKVYLGGTVVFISDSLNLNLGSPLTAFLEIDTTIPAKMLYGTFIQFYETKGGNVTIKNIPAAASNVTIIGQSGNLIASAPVTDGSASANLEELNFPVTASIKVLCPNGSLLASSSQLEIFGGDVYSIHSASFLENTVVTSIIDSRMIVIAVPIALVGVALSVFALSKKGKPEQSI
jgi:hypothetical protein